MIFYEIISDLTDNLIMQRQCSNIIFVYREIILIDKRGFRTLNPFVVGAEKE